MDLPPKEMGAGNVLFEIRKYIVERESPVRAITSGSLSIVVTILGPPEGSVEYGYEVI